MIEFRTLGPVDLGPDPDGELAAVLAQPKRLAILAYLATAASSGGDARTGKPVFVRRDTLSALFWPDHDQEHARSSLRQALRGLRRALGPNAILTQGYEAVALDPRAVWCDAAAFEAHMAAGARATAVDLYRGDFLTGFFLTDAPDFERWMEDRRARLRHAACSGARAMAESYGSAGKLADATTMARRAADWCSDDEGVVRSLIALLDRAGDRAGALQAYDVFARRLKEDYDCDPAAETQSLMATIRARASEYVPWNDNSSRDAPAHIAAVQARLTAAGSQPLGAPDSATTAEPVLAGRSREPAMAGLGAERDRWAWPRASMRRALFAGAATLALGAAGLVARGLHRGASLSAEVATAPDQLPNVTVHVPEARALFHAGIDRLYANQPEDAARLLTDALARDSSCAMCAYYAFRAEWGANGTSAQHMLDVAQRLSGRVSLRERLLIHYAYADNDNDPARLAIAESLSAASREAPESEIALGESLMMADRAAEAILHFERAISLDSANLRGHGASPLCWACDAEHWLLAALFALDSVDAAVRAGHTWAVEQPRSADAWNTFAEALTRAARNGEASAALDSGALYESKSDELLARARLDLEADRYDSADALLGQLVGTGTVPNRTDAIWLQVISLRAQGRRREALSVAQGPMRWVEHALEGTAPLQFAPIAEAQALFELGRYREAALVFRMLAQRPAGVTRVRPHLLARQNAWWLTHLADALAAAGDTESLGALADSIEAWGSNSGFARDQWVHRYVRALLWMARSRTDSAVAQLLASHLVRPGGFSRANLALAKCEIRLHNPGAAILALRPSLHSEVEGGNYYATRTEVHEAMAQAFDAAGQVDSAAAHYRAVISAWAKADPELLSRVKQAKARLLYLERHETKS